MKFLRYLFVGLLFILLLGLLPSGELTLPVAGAHRTDINKDSFWFFPWGKSITHKGVDIFAKKGTDVLASCHGLILSCGTNPRGGNYILMLGPKWRLHYYAHLKTTQCSAFSFTKEGTPIGKVGTTGNAKGKPPHLHYTVFSLLPYPWRIDKSPQGYKKMFYLNPLRLFKKENN